MSAEDWWFAYSITSKGRTLDLLGLLEYTKRAVERQKLNGV